MGKSLVLTGNEKIIITGTSKCGKSELAEYLCIRHGLRHIDISYRVQEFMEYYKIKKEDFDDDPCARKRVYDKFFKDFIERPIQFNVLEIASDWPYEILPELKEILDQKFRIVNTLNHILVYCHASPEACYMKNSQCDLLKRVPEKLIREQAKYTAKDHKNIAEKLGFDYVFVDTEKLTIQGSYEQLIRGLRVLKRQNMI